MCRWFDSALGHHSHGVVQCPARLWSGGVCVPRKTGTAESYLADSQKLSRRQITGVEEFYFQSGIQSIKLDAVDVARISDTNSLRLSGLGTVTLDDSYGAWSTSAGPTGYTLATSGSASVLVQNSMTLAFS